VITPLRSALAIALGSYVASPADPLRVMRATPANEAEAGAVVTVVFDRPIAAGLDATVDPATIFRIAPRVAGKLEWRDPVTIRFTPSAPLAFGTTYTVTIANTFQAMDGSRLEQPYTFSFRVSGPRVEDAWPVNRWSDPKHLTPTNKFYLLLDGLADPKSVESMVKIKAPSCGRPEIGLKAVTVRRIKRDDPRWSWYRRPDSSERHRVAELVPERPIPAACAAELGVPERIDSVTAMRWWKFRTYGPLAVEWSGCWYWRDDNQQRCPVGPAALRFTTPVRGAEVLRRVRLTPALSFTVRDTSEESDTWSLEAELKPQTRYSIAVDAGLTDVFGQRLATPYAQSFMTTSYTPTVRYPHGRMVVERNSGRLLAVQHVNVDTLELLVAGIPDSLEGQALARSWGWEDLWSRLLPAAARRTVPVTAPRDAPRVTGVRLPVYNAARPGSPTLLAVKVRSNQADPNDRWQPVALVQVTDLAIQARIGAGEGVVWVTGVGDGRPRAGAAVTLHDREGRVRARATTDAQGLARLAGFATDTAAGVGDDEEEWGGDFQEFDGYVAATLGTDRALVAVSRYDPDLSPWQFNVRAAWGDERRSEAATVFTERGIYRPGEPLYAKAIVRKGPLGALRAPPPGDSLRWVFSDRENGTLKDTTVALSAFGTADQTLTLGPDLPLGTYRVRIEGERDGQWRVLAATSYRIAEYRPPEFQVSATADSGPRFAGDSLQVSVEARYLFGAPMGRARVSWVARTTPAWWVDIPGADDYYLGETGWWWEDDDPSGSGGTRVYESGQDTLDASGRLRLTVPVAPPPRGRAASTTVEATVTDVNRQTVSAAASALVHPASFYVGARVAGSEYFWVAGKPRTINLIAVTPAGRRVPDVAIRGALVHREWHRVRRERGGYSEEVGEWVSDTVGRCAVVSAAEPVSCTFTPQAGGQYVVGFSATDQGGRVAATSFWRWASGKDWVPWSDESKFKMDVIPDKTRYTVGDTATILLASPFTDAEAWITVEREGLLEQRRLRLASGSMTLKLPITEAHVPNAFVSIIVVRGRSQPPGPPDDPGRPTLRVGYAELRVTPEVKRLRVEVRPAQSEYRPGDSARVRIQVRDARNQGRRAEVTLWAVDEGVLSLTGYKTPDPLDLLYRPRGLGLRLASNLVSVAPQVRDSASVDKGQEPGSGGGMDVEGILRSRFQTTAFFLGAVVTDDAGRATAVAKLPDNLTTFRVMAVAVTTGDRYGSGQSPLLVTRPLLARPALPRFVRADDQYAAGVVVNHRLGGTPTVKVEAWSRGVTLVDPPTRDVVLEAGRGREARFAFRGIAGDSAAYRFRVSSGSEADAVETRVPIRPAFHARAFAASGVLYDTATAELVFPEALDPARSRVELSLGTSPLALVRGFRRELQVYPYFCSEQIASAALPLIALYQAQKQLGGAPFLKGDPAREIREAVVVLSRRQRDDGGIGLWSSRDWTSPWLSAHAGRTLLAARSAGVPVSDTVLHRLGDYLTQFLRKDDRLLIPVAFWYDDRKVWLSERVAATDFVSRLGRPDMAAENALWGLRGQLSWEDRVWLAEIVMRRRQVETARALLEPTWREIRVEGRRAVLPADAERKFYFSSSVRGVARLLTATLAVDPRHPLVGPLVETLAQRGRVAGQQADWWWGWWNTQDYAAAVQALATYEWQRRQTPPRPVRLRQGARVVLQGTAGGVFNDTSVALTGLLTAQSDGKPSLRLGLEAAAPGDPVFWFLTVREVPAKRPVTPFDQGIQVERWYERYETGQPVTTVAEGDLVRVRLRIKVPVQRHFVVLDDALPAGLEAVDLSLRTQGALPPREDGDRGEEGEGLQEEGSGWYYGYWEYGWWSPFDHRELRDDRVVYSATTLWPGTYTATYVARATTPGVFVRPPVHAEEMYNPAVNGRSDGGVFTVTQKR